MSVPTRGGNPLHAEPGPDGLTCGDCAWAWRGGRGRPVDRCVRHGDQRIDRAWAACSRHQAPLECTECGACCREAYHRVEVSPRDPFVRLHPDRVSEDEGHLVVTRNYEICGCLTVDGGRYTCQVYEDRPWTCRGFTKGSANCLEARRRLRMSR